MILHVNRELFPSQRLLARIFETDKITLELIDEHSLVSKILAEEEDYEKIFYLIKDNTDEIIDIIKNQEGRIVIIQTTSDKEGKLVRRELTDEIVVDGNTLYSLDRRTQEVIPIDVIIEDLKAADDIQEK